MFPSPAGPLERYTSLRDKNLILYFSNPKKTEHLEKMGLITKEGEIVDEATIRLNTAKREQTKNVKKLMYANIAKQKAEREKQKQIELKRKLEHLARMERVNKIRAHHRHPAGVQDDFNPHCHDWREDSTGDSELSTKLLHRPQSSMDILHQRLGYTDSEVALYHSIARPKIISNATLSSPYGISSGGGPLLQPRPPSTPRPAPVGRGLAPKRRSAAKKRLLSSSDTARLKNQPEVLLEYNGPSLNLERSSGHILVFDIVILQQHCGGNTVCVFKGRVPPKGTIKFTSRRHSDCPFGVSIYVDGLIDCRMSACCEHKYRPGRIGGRTGHFSLVHVTGSSPCTKCQKSEERGTVKATLGSIKSQKIWSSTSKNSSSATKISQQYHNDHFIIQNGEKNSDTTNSRQDSSEGIVGGGGDGDSEDDDYDNDVFDDPEEKEAGYVEEVEAAEKKSTSSSDTTSSSSSVSSVMEAIGTPENKATEDSTQEGSDDKKTDSENEEIEANIDAKSDLEDVSTENTQSTLNKIEVAQSNNMEVDIPDESVQPKDEKVVAVQPKDEKVAAVQPKDEKVAAVQPKDEKVAAVQPKDEKVAAVQPKDEKVVAVQPKDEKVVAVQPKDEKVVAVQPKDEKVVAVQPKDEKVAAVQPKDEKVAAVQPKDEKVAADGLEGKHNLKSEKEVINGYSSANSSMSSGAIDELMENLSLDSPCNVSPSTEQLNSAVKDSIPSIEITDWNIGNLEDREIEKLEDREIEKMEDKGIEKLEDREIEKLEDREIEKLEDREIEKMEDKGIEKLEDREIEKLEDREIEKLEDRGIENLTKEIAHMEISEKLATDSNVKDDSSLISSSSSYSLAMDSDR